MAIPTDFASEDDAPEFLREHLTKREDGRFAVQMLTADGQKIGNVAGIAAALEKIKGEKGTVAEQARKAAEQLARYKLEDDQLLDPEEALSALQKVRSGKFKDAGELDAARKEIEAKFQESFGGKMKDLEGKLTARETKLREVLVDSTAIQSLSRTNCADANMMLPHVRSMVKVVDADDGNMRTVVLNEQGNPRVSLRDGQEGQEMGVEEFCQDILPKMFPAAFPSKAEGAGPGGRGASTGSKKLRDQLSGAALLKAARIAQSKR